MKPTLSHSLRRVRRTVLNLAFVLSVGTGIGIPLPTARLKLEGLMQVEEGFLPSP